MMPMPRSAVSRPPLPRPSCKSSSQAMAANTSCRATAPQEAAPPLPGSLLALVATAAMTVAVAAAARRRALRMMNTQVKRGAAAAPQGHPRHRQQAALLRMLQPRPSPINSPQGPTQATTQGTIPASSVTCDALALMVASRLALCDARAAAVQGQALGQVLALGLPARHGHHLPGCPPARPPPCSLVLLPPPAATCCRQTRCTPPPWSLARPPCTQAPALPAPRWVRRRNNAPLRMCNRVAFGPGYR